MWAQSALASSTVASESSDDDDGKLWVDNAPDDNDFVAKDTARALQSLFRSNDGYDEELA